MFDNRRMRFFPTQPEIDIYQIIREAQNRWLRPLEVIEILRNYQKFRLNPVPPNKPPSGSLFLFDRKTLRFFRKDGHNWRKKKDGKTVREAHERLKAGSVDVLHCYYAHGEDNPNFQRRSYWMLEGAYEHIVLVHYREVTEGSRSSVYRSMQEAKENASQQTSARPISQGMPASSPSISDADVTGPYKSPEAPVTPFESEGTDSGDEGDANSNHVAVVEHTSLLHQVSRSNVKEELSKQPVSQGLDNVDFDDLLRNPEAYLGPKSITSPAGGLDVNAWNTLLENCRATGPPPQKLDNAQEFRPNSFVPANVSNQATNSFHTFPGGHGAQNMPSKLPESHYMEVDSRHVLAQGSSVDFATNDLYQKAQAVDASDSYRVGLPDTQIDDEAKNSLKKMDSFGRWMSREIGEDSQSSLLSGSTDHGAYWTLEDHSTFDEISSFSQQMHLDVGLGPSLSQDQQFSIVDFSPDWAFSSEETKVIVAGNVLKGDPNSTWFCMFGELEVPAESIQDGVLRCKAPPHTAGRVPLYITRGNRIACSEVREFEYRAAASKTVDVAISSDPLQIEDKVLQLRFAKLISICADVVIDLESCDKALSAKIQELTSNLENQWADAEQQKEADDKVITEIVVETLLKQQLERWLLVKLCENENGASVIDTNGQCCLHLASALGYDWAVGPILAAGVGINFRDVHGWTALHWAASRGREAVVSRLLAAGASPGLVTDPTPQYASGRTPADLAAGSGHKGMAGLLAEMSLTSHLTSLALKEASTNEIDSFSAVLAEEKAVELISDTAESAKSSGEQTLLQGSLRAVRNAARAAALIHASFRQESFKRRQEKLGEEVDEYGMSMNDVKRMTSLHAERGGNRHHHLRKEQQHSAATKIQQKYRGWKGRKDFLLLRQRVVKIQAHYRGHQVRRKFKRLLWTVGIIDKAVLRWRRKRSGLRNFQASEETRNGDDDEVLKAGRKQKEAQFQKAVTRVQSMVRSQQAQEQYQRIQEAYLQAVAGATTTTQPHNEDEAMVASGD